MTVGLVTVSMAALVKIKCPPLPHSGKEETPAGSDRIVSEASVKPDSLDLSSLHSPLDSKHCGCNQASSIKTLKKKCKERRGKWVPKIKNNTAVVQSEDCV